MILYGGPASPFVRKTRITVIELGLAERVEVVITRPAARADIIPRHNQLGKIPVLVKEDGEAVYDSAVICEYLESIGHGEEIVPGHAAGVDDGVVVVEDAEREIVLAQVFPDVLGRVQLGRIGRQADGSDVLWQLELIGGVPAGAVED